MLNFVKGNGALTYQKLKKMEEMWQKNEKSKLDLGI